MRFKLASGAEIVAETDAEVQLILSRLGLGSVSPAGKLSAEADLPPVVLPVVAPLPIPDVPALAASVWDPAKVKALYGGLTQLGRSILNTMASKGEMATEALAAELRLADVKGLGGSLAAIRRAAALINLPDPLQSVVTDGTRSVVVDKGFRSAVLHLRAIAAREKAQAAGT